MQSISPSLNQLIRYMDHNQYCGYDPYDALNSPFIRHLPGKWTKILATQALKRLPVNIRPAIGIKKGINPKAMALCLQAWCTLHKSTGLETYKTRAEECFRWLLGHSSKGYSGLCWGYNFPWISPVKYLESHSPTGVVTAFVVRGLHAYYREFNSRDALEAIRSAADFIRNDLHRTETAEGICFSYSVKRAELCYNAGLLAAEILCRLWSEQKEDALKDLATAAFEYALHRQKADGRWNYSADIKTGGERQQVDFHQGFILESLNTFIDTFNPADEKYQKALDKGLAFYRKEQFEPDGRAKWRLPSSWPADIHHQAQGIITFSSVNHGEHADFAGRVAGWTIRNMQDRKGCFHFRKYRSFTNKIPYIRWGQAWMLLALARLQALES